MSTSSSSSSKLIVLKASDGETFEVEEIVASESQTIKHMIEDGCADSAISLPIVKSNILSKVVEYCKTHVEAPKTEDNKVSDEDLKSFDAKFVKVDEATLFDLILAADYLNIKGLLDLTCQTWAISNATTSGDTPEQLKHLVSQHCVKPLCDQLFSGDPKIVTDCLTGLENILKLGEREKKGYVNLYAEMIDDAELVQKLVALETHRNKEISEKAVELFHTLLHNWAIRVSNGILP